MKGKQKYIFEGQALSTPFIFFVYRCAELPCNIVTFGEQCIDAALAFGNVTAHIELAVDSHVINRIELRQIS